MLRSAVDYLIVFLAARHSLTSRCLCDRLDRDQSHLRGSSGVEQDEGEDVEEGVRPCVAASTVFAAVEHIAIAFVIKSGDANSDGVERMRWRKGSRGRGHGHGRRETWTRSWYGARCRAHLQSSREMAERTEYNGCVVSVASNAFSGELLFSIDSDAW